MHFVLMFTFLMASGDVLTTEQIAVDGKHRPITTQGECEIAARDAMLRLQEAIAFSKNGVLQDASVICLKAKERR